jgi:hypothetical protein
MSDSLMDDDDDVVLSSTTTPPVVVRIVGSIFDDDMIEKYSDKEGKPRWTCKWCSQDYSGWNATKVIRHLNKVVGGDIKPCKAKIDEEYIERYRHFATKMERKRTHLLQSLEAIDRSISTHNHVTASALDERRSFSSSISTKKSKPSNDINPNDSPPQSTTLFSSKSNDTRNYQQLKIHDGPNPSADSKLTMCIADMVHSLGLPFSLTSDPKFRKVITLARAVGSNYNPPSRNMISNELLDLNYDQYKKKNMSLLSKDEMELQLRRCL